MVPYGSNINLPCLPNFLLFSATFPVVIWVTAFKQSINSTSVLVVTTVTAVTLHTYCSCCSNSRNCSTGL